MIPFNQRILESAIQAKKNTNFLQPNEFRLVFHRIPNVVYFCQSVKIPEISFGNTTQPSMFATPIRIPGTKIEYGSFDVSFPVSEDMKNWMEIFNWVTKIPPNRDFTGITEYKEVFSDATLIILNSVSRPFIKVDFINCFPVSLAELNLTTTVTDINPIMSSSSFAYTGYVVEYIDKSLESVS
jgi:hypothetical protein